MSAQIAAYGRLGADPVKRTSPSGKEWATASIAVGTGDDDAPTIWLGIVAFDRLAETLCRHAKGGTLSVSGRLKLNRWRDKEGAEREQWQVVADAIVSAHGARPSGGGRRRHEAGEVH